MFPKLYMSTYMMKIAAPVLNAAGLTPNFKTLSLAASVNAPITDVQTALSTGHVGMDGWLLSPQLSGSMVALGALQDLSAVVQGAVLWTCAHWCQVNENGAEVG